MNGIFLVSSVTICILYPGTCFVTRTLVKWLFALLPVLYALLDRRGCPLRLHLTRTKSTHQPTKAFSPPTPPTPTLPLPD